MKKLLFSTLVFVTSAASAQGLLQNIQTAAVVDLVAPLYFENSEASKLDIRGAEFMFFGPLDPVFDAHLNLAVHSEEGETVTALHEGFISSSKLIPSSRFRVGKFFLGVGRLNQFHPHDWPFISPPKVHADFFAAEGVADTGGEFSTLLPFESYWDVTLGVTNGYTFGHTHDLGAKPRTPTHYIHPVNFIDFGEAGALQWGASYLGRTDAQGLRTHLYGLDFVFKKSSGKVLDLLMQSELWLRERKPESAEAQHEAGAYLYSQKALSEKVFLGLRVDLFSDLSRQFVSDGSRQENLEYAVVPTLTWKNSEFMLLRSAYTYNVQTFRGESDHIEQRLEFQIIAVLGAHPAHSF